MRKVLSCMLAMTVLMGPVCFANAENQVSDPIMPVEEMIVTVAPVEEPEIADFPIETEEPNIEVEEPNIEVEEPNIEVEEIPVFIEEEPTPTPPPRAVRIYCSTNDKIVEEGTLITLTSELINFLPTDIVTYQWEYREPDGEWRNVEGGNEPTLTFRVDMTNYRNYWRVAVTYKESD